MSFEKVLSKFEDFDRKKRIARIILLSSKSNYGDQVSSLNSNDYGSLENITQSGTKYRLVFLFFILATFGGFSVQVFLFFGKVAAFVFFSLACIIAVEISEWLWILNRSKHLPLLTTPDRVPLPNENTQPARQERRKISGNENPPPLYTDTFLFVLKLVAITGISLAALKFCNQIAKTPKEFPRNINDWLLAPNQWHAKINNHLRAKNAVPIVNSSGENWFISIENSENRLPVQKDYENSKAECIKKGADWRLLGSSIELKELKPEIKLTRTLKVWLDGGEVLFGIPQEGFGGSHSKASTWSEAGILCVSIGK